MQRISKKKVIRLLGVGFDTEDGHIRITNGENHDVYMGSEESHHFLNHLIELIEVKIKEQGRTLETISPAELVELVESVVLKRR